MKTTNISEAVVKQDIVNVTDIFWDPLNKKFGAIKTLISKF